MAFRKRNVGISQVQRTSGSSRQESTDAAPDSIIPGVRPSPVDGRPTTSTGTPSLDGILAGHAGLALGNSLLIEESGTTDFAAALVRYYAAEGLVQGHKVHVVGFGEHWGRELPGLVGPADDREAAAAATANKEKMKIAWRYERLGDFRAGAIGSRGPPPPVKSAEKHRVPDANPTDVLGRSAFCHTFDLAKRLTLPDGIKIDSIPVLNTRPDVSPFTSVLDTLTKQLRSDSKTSLHRLVIPAILSPALYPPHACHPRYLLQFFHSLRGLLRLYPNQLTAMITLPLDLFPRSSGLVRWMELLSDGVFELAPFADPIESSSASASSAATTAQENQPQGILKIHSLPVFHERGGGGGGGSTALADDLAFVVSRRKFLIKPFNLPPVEGEGGNDMQRDEASEKKTKQSTADMEF